MKREQKTYYKLHYRDPESGKVITLKCQCIEDSSLGLGFIKASEFIFETKGILVKPSEEQMRQKLENVKSIHLSIYSILSIEEKGASHQGLKFQKDRSNLITLPSEKGT